MSKKKILVKDVKQTISFLKKENNAKFKEAGDKKPKNEDRVFSFWGACNTNTSVIFSNEDTIDVLCQDGDCAFCSTMRKTFKNNVS